MWDLKLQLLETIDYLFIFFNFFLNSITNYSQISLNIINFNINYQFIFNSSIIFGFKFLITIAFLVLIRGGTPRYRYDYLTKLGWLKFINIIIFSFFFSLINIFTF